MPMYDYSREEKERADDYFSKLQLNESAKCCVRKGGMTV